MPSLLVPIPLAAQRGGFEGYFGDLCASLPARGWEVTGITIPVRARDKDWEFPQFWDHVDVIGRPWWSVRDFAEALRAEITRRKPDIVMSYPYDAPLITGPNVPSGPRVVERVGGCDRYEVSRLRRWWRYFDGVMGISSATQAAIHEGLIGVPEESKPMVARISHGLRLPSCIERQPRVRGSALRLLWVGRIKHHVKRALDLVNVLKCLSQHGVAIDLTVVGEGDDAAALQEGLSSVPGTSVKLVGLVQNEQIFRCYLNADVFINTSEHEGGPRTLIEAMACECVPVVSDIAGYSRELVQEGVTGFRVPVGDCEQFASVIHRIDQDRSLCDKIGAECRGVVYPRFTIDRMADDTDSFLRTILSRPSRRQQARASADLDDFLGKRRWYLPNSLRLGLRRLSCSLGLVEPVES